MRWKINARTQTFFRFGTYPNIPLFVEMNWLNHRSCVVTGVCVRQQHGATASQPPMEVQSRQDATHKQKTKVFVGGDLRVLEGKLQDDTKSKFLHVQNAADLQPKSTEEDEGHVWRLNELEAHFYNFWIFLWKKNLKVKHFI